MIKNFVLLFALVSVLFSGTGCIKDVSCQEKTIASEEAEIQNFAAINSINAIKHSSGLYYEIISQGTGPAPTLQSNLSVRYTGKRLDGTVFDEQLGTPVTFALSGVILGWQLGLPLIQEGGVIRLIIPSSFAYGCAGKAPIAPYSILYFEIQLVDVI